ncbi:UDP-N-acetylmuramyl pentapeptide phosphotransferase/UDP-N-acetylglucosamine-1-phosphate transferase [Tissierella praeacuta]|uniref:phospho-N-acetylmuramoyl-pentapeptide- transferase n=1 Tax=Tissierella praeacuta TaxID=43131 RepID=UPI0010536C93|nr:phospho-N-acetylmuramoyl-pentapeptide-transferase [Tissierella praeacuta]TCU72765.1 UDP-N-acetylmuramyl pentapeptide phosphotransferase/UDP-N-acetylglucosamine-1-phosphate transferase [Tissierella praeacuta]
MYYCGITSFILSFILSSIALPMLIDMLFKSNVVCENFKSSLIPTSMGIVFVFVQVITLGILKILFDFNDNLSLVYLLGFVFIGLLGLFDDLTGEKKIKGLKGHIKAFFKGVLTTGAIKAFLGFFISLVVSSYISNSLKDFMINSFLIGLFTNFINLFDLRPGRAVKIFMIISLVFIFSNLLGNSNYILFSFLGILIPYIILDLKAKAMMGDVGSNTLGFTLGLYAATSFNLTIKSIILILLIIIHIMAEKVSFSKVIDNNKILKFLDNIGR